MSLLNMPDNSAIRPLYLLVCNQILTAQMRRRIAQDGIDYNTSLMINHHEFYNTNEQLIWRLLVELDMPNGNPFFLLYQHSVDTYWDSTFDFKTFIVNYVIEIACKYEVEVMMGIYKDITNIKVDDNGNILDAYLVWEIGTSYEIVVNEFRKMYDLSPSAYENIDIYS